MALPPAAGPEGSVKCCRETATHPAPMPPGSTDDRDSLLELVFFLQARCRSGWQDSGAVYLGRQLIVPETSVAGDLAEPPSGLS